MVRRQKTNLTRRPECIPDQFCLVHNLVGTAAAIQRRDDAEVTPDCTAEVYKADNECDFLVSGHYERSYCIPVPKTDGVKKSV